MAFEKGASPNAAGPISPPAKKPASAATTAAADKKKSPGAASGSDLRQVIAAKKRSRDGSEPEPERPRRLLRSASREVAGLG